MKSVYLITVLLLPIGVVAQEAFVGECASDTAKTVNKRIDSWTGSDKLAHLTVSALITASGYGLYKDAFDEEPGAVGFGAGLSFTLGVAKEVLDKKKPHGFFSWKDLTANLVGIVLACIVLSAI